MPGRSDESPVAAPRPGPLGIFSRALVALDRAGVGYAVMRAVYDVPGLSGDVDLLIPADDLGKAEHTLRVGGWISAPSSGHGSHRFFVTYDEESGRWYELDLVTRIDYGPLQAYRTELASPCLERRIQDGEFPVLDPSDCFWLMFLHLVWRQLTPKRREELAAQASVAHSSGPVAEFVAAHLQDPAASLQRILAAARAADEEGVRTAQAALQQHWRRSQLLEIVAHETANWLLRRTSIPQAPGLTVALLGLDGAGKTTVATTLRQDIPWPTVSLYMGVWRESRLDNLFRHVMGARLVLRLGRLSRTGLLARYHRALGRLVILDRYVIDANLPSSTLDWKGKVSAYFVLKTAAEPDRLVFLDASPEVVFNRKGELTIEELRGRRDTYLAFERRFTHMLTVDAEQPLQQVILAVNRVVWDDLVRSRSSVADRARLT